MKKKYLLILVIVLFLCSCGLTHRLTKKIRPWHGVLKKRVMVAPMLDLAELGEKHSSAICSELIELLSASEHLVVFKAPIEREFQLDPKSLGLGIVISQQLISKAQSLGMNALITGVINPIEITDKKKGIWPFKKVVKNYEVSVSLNLVDTATETLLLTKVLSESITISMEEAQETNPEALKGWAMEKTLPQLLKTFAEEVEDALSQEPWIGQIVSVGGSFRINAGQDVGVQIGHRFAVFVPEKKLISVDKRQFPIRWKKIGEIEVIEVEKDESLAKPLMGEGFAQGQRIQFMD